MDRAMPPQDEVVVRNLRPHDSDAVVGIDARTMGRRREEFFLKTRA